MKKITTLLVFLIFAQSADALEWKFWESSKFNLKSKYCVQKCDTRSCQIEKNEVKDFIDSLNVASNKHDIKTLKTHYSKDFKSYDGFDLETFFKMVEESFTNYPDISYSSDIKDINVYGDWATVALYDKVSATHKTESSQISDDAGILNGICDYVLYLKKENGYWKVTSDYIIAEETSLKYGEAKKIQMTIEVPMLVKSGEEYTIALESDYPKDVFMLASLNREPIIYPPDKPDDSFRKMPPDGILERIVRAGGAGKNEYAMASVGITKFYTSEDKSAINVKMSGLALLLKRVSVER